MNRPYSQACENNKEPIRQVLIRYLREPATLLEIGSGTGQHGYYITEHHPRLTWLTSDVKDNLPGINAWVEAASRHNFHPPMELDINQAQWHQEKVDIVYSANTAHIMSWGEVEKLFQFIPQCLSPQGYFLLYGPFNYGGKFTSESNARFNDWLKSQAPHRAIRDFEAVNQLAQEQHLTLIDDHEMPANNRTLVWQLQS